MKKIYTLLVILLCSMNAVAANFYWVGGNGNWSDFQHHWAISSGGNVFQTTVPSAFDNVFFDNNSFPRSSDSTVQLDVAIVYANNINFSTASKKTYLTFGSSSTLHIYGSAFFGPKVSLISHNNIGLSQIHFKSTTPGNSITLNKIANSTDLIFDGIGGGWILNDLVLETHSIFLYNGSLDLRGKKVIGHSFRGDIFPTNRTLLFSGAQLSFVLCYINSENLQYDYLHSSISFSELKITGNPINTDTLKAITKDSFYPSSALENVNANTLISHTAESISIRDCNISNLNSRSQSLGIQNAVIGTIKTDDLSSVAIAGKLTITNDWIMQDANNCSKRIFWNGGTIEKTSGTLTFYNAIFSDVTATGGAIFNTVNSFNFNNTSSGFIFNIPIQTYYWIGDSGNWEDHSHWSLSSGGTAAGCYPGPHDTIILDEHSFSSSGNHTITQTTPIYMGSLDASRLIGNVNAPANIYVAGSFYLSPFFHMDGELVCSSLDTDNEIYFNGASLNAALFVQSTFGDWAFKDSVTCRSLVFRGAGTIHSNGQKITTSFFKGEGPEGIFSGSTIVTDNLNYADFVSNFDNCHVILPLGGYVELNTPVKEISASGDLSIKIKSAEKVSCTGTLDWLQSESIDSLVIREGSFVNLPSPSSTITIKDISIVPYSATCGQLTTFNNNDANAITTFNKTSGTLKVKHTILSNIHASGGASFIAEESVDVGNNEGWVFTTLPSKTFYWIGGTGNWDSTSHWSLQSGGSAVGCLPSILDNVVIDEASFSGPYQTITRANIPIQVSNFTVQGIPENTSLELENVWLSGDLVLSKNIKDSRTNFRLLGKGVRTIKAGGCVVRNVTFEADSITVLDDITIAELIIKKGYTDMRNRVITAYYLSIYSYNANDSVIVDVRNSLVKTQLLSISAEKTKLLSDHSTIRFIGFARMLVNAENVIREKVKFDKIEITDPNMTGGQLSLANTEINSLYIKFNSNDLYITLDGCIIHNFYSSTNLNLQIYDFSNNFGKSYIETAQLKNRVRITSNSNHIGYLKLEPGTYLGLYSQTLYIDQYLDAIGTSTLPITITSLLNNAQTTISGPPGQICCSYLTLSNVKAIGSQFYAGPSSIDIYNNSGWNFIDSCEIITVNSSQPICKGQPMSIYTTHPDFVQGFLWSGPQSYYSNSADITINPLTDSTQGLYSLLAGGQIRKILIHYEQPPDTVIYVLTSSDQDYIQFQTPPSSGEITSINWYKDGVLYNNDNSTGIIAIQNGAYYAEILTTVGCPYTTNTILYTAGTDTLTVLKAPYQLKAELVGEDGVLLTWNDDNTDETGFALYRSTQPNGPYTYIGYSIKDATSTFDMALTKGVTYYYKMRALRSPEASLYSDTTSITIRETNDPSDYSITVKPVPVLDQLTIESAIPITQLSIYDQAGAIHFSQNFDALTTIELDVKNMPQGFYFLKTTTETGESYMRFVK